jgi:hypothetical protein
MKQILFLILIAFSTIFAQTTSHTYGPVKENNFETWNRLNSGTPLGAETVHSFGITVHTGGDTREYRNINFWTWNNDDIPKEAIVIMLD